MGRGDRCRLDSGDGRRRVHLPRHLGRHRSPSTGELRIGWGELIAAVSACFGLVFVYVLSVDWRAAWLVVVVTLVFYAAHRSYGGLRRRTADVESVSDFTRRLAGFLDMPAVVEETLRTAAVALHAEISEIHLGDREAPHDTVWRLDRRTDEVPREIRLEDSYIQHVHAPRTTSGSRWHRRARRADPVRRAGLRNAITVAVLHEGVPVG